MSSFIVRTVVFLLTFILSFYAMNAIDYQRFLKQGHVREAQILYWLIVLALAYLSGSFVLALININI